MKANPKIGSQELVKIGKAEHIRVQNWHRDLGTYAHSFIELGETPSPDHPEFGKHPYIIYNSWMEFLSDSELSRDDMEFEKPFIGFGAHGNYGGTLDAIMRNPDGTHTIIELKSSRNLDPKHGVQAAAYARLAMQAGYRPSNILVVRLGKYKVEWEARRVNFDNGVAAFDAKHQAYLLTQETQVFM